MPVLPLAVFVFAVSHCGCRVRSLGGLLDGGGRFGLGGGYSIVGRSAGSSLPATAASFALALPLCAGVVWMFMPAAPVLTTYGALLAVLSGTLTSAMGYGVWYWILPQISASVASVSQLVVPVLAMAAGMVFLDEALTMKFVIACALVLSGIALSLGVHRSRQSL